MWRGIFFFLKLAILIAIAVWLVERPGHVAVQWLGYEIQTNVALLVLALLVLLAASALLYRGYRGLLRAPRDIRSSLAGNRRERGYRALTHGMVAVAAGDPKEAERWARKADQLLDEPPLTRLLSAQAAQLNGDEAAARTYFTQMLESEETRFLGLRGLVAQALRDGDEAAAQKYLRDAHALRPDTPWVLNSLFELSEKSGDLITAEDALRQAERRKTLPRPEAARKRAVVLLKRALAADIADGDAAVRDAREANRLAPGLIPAAALLAQLNRDHGRTRRAAQVLEQAWAHAPHPDLAELYGTLRQGESAIERVKRLERLVAMQPDHTESHLALARAALDAHLWGQARRHLTAAAGEQPEYRTCRLMAELEDGEHGDSAAAAEWWRRAETAEPDPAWVCGNCGAAADAWSAHCGACQAFDSLSWRRPPRVAVALPVPEEQLKAPEEAIDATAAPAEAVEEGTASEGARPG